MNAQIGEAEISMKKKTQVGIIGMGAIGAIHAEAYLANNTEAELVALCDVNETRLRSLGEKHQIKQLFTDYRLLLKYGVDAVSICVGNAFHCKTAVAALKSGKNVLLEKPMAMNAREAGQIVAAACRSRKILQMGMVKRQYPDVQLVHEYVREGRFGNIYHINILNRRRRGIPGLGGWFTTKSMSGGGSLIDLGVHDLDAAMYMSGLWKPTSVNAATYANFGQPMKDYHYVSMWAGPPNRQGVFNVEDSATGFVRFDGNATLKFEITWAVNAEDETCIDILGDKGGARVFDGKPLRIFTEHGKRIVDIHPHLPPVANVFYRQAATFLAACRGKCPPLASGEEGGTLMKLLDAIYESARSKVEVRIPA